MTADQEVVQSLVAVAASMILPQNELDSLIIPTTRHVPHETIHLFQSFGRGNKLLLKPHNTGTSLTILNYKPHKNQTREINKYLQIYSGQIVRRFLYLRNPNPSSMPIHYNLAYPFPNLEESRISK